MEKLFVTVIILYAIFVGVYFLYLDAGSKRKKDVIGKGSPIQATRQLETDIVGKSKFDIRASKPPAAKPVPPDATSQKSENPQEKPDIFVTLNDVGSPAEVAQEELDGVFSDTPPDENNEPMDIDYPLEYGSPEDDEEMEDETEEVEGAAQEALASGVEFEDLGNAVRAVNRRREVTPEQRKKAGDTLLEIRQTDMFEQLVSGKPDAKKIVTDLMAESFADFHRRKDKESGTNGSGKKAPDNFNIRDFA